MDGHDADLAARRRLLFWLAVMGTLVVLVVTTTSAFLRVSAAGLGCDDWPQCYGRMQLSDLSRAAMAPSPVRILHRICASLAGASALGIGLIALTQPRKLRFELIASGVLLAVALGLAVLGRATPGASVPAVALSNVLGGMLMALVLLRVALAQRDGEPVHAAPAWLGAICWLALALTFVQVGLGVLTSASYSGLACTALPGCTEQGFPGEWSAADLDPWRAAAASASIHMAHRAASVLAAAAVLALGWGLIRLGASGRPLGVVLVVLLAAQVLLGALLVHLGLPRPLAVAHNAGAGLLLLALAAAQHRVSRTAGPRPALI